ncbi:hypothetical protein ETB97_012679 [Aspergillus alliaceus]|uniref:Uncharacterized protein n=1 Tax=Petromyces alliaceus TaxID=209559 RepID=A0A8H6E0Y9_PETAA|nr:hypothetical protein ETB97_012679 [Aspergillus burnettii]
MDGFLKESQRLNPPGELAFHRVVKHDLTLSDGLLLPKGTHICMASGPISRDPEVIGDPEVFDAYRFIKQNTATSGFVSTGPNNMHFGLGRRFLMEYEFRFSTEQKERPKNLLIGDKIVPNVSMAILIKKRVSDV